MEPPPPACKFELLKTRLPFESCELDESLMMFELDDGFP